MYSRSQIVFLSEYFQARATIQSNNAEDDIDKIRENRTSNAKIVFICVKIAKGWPSKQIIRKQSQRRVNREDTSPTWVGHFLMTTQEHGGREAAWTADPSLAFFYMMSGDKICSRQSSNFSLQIFHHHFPTYVLKKGLLDSSSSPEYITGSRLQWKTDEWLYTFFWKGYKWHNKT